MFAKKILKMYVISEENFPYSHRLCNIYISEHYKQILYVPYGKVNNGTYAELENLIIDSWPCKFGDLQMNIEEALNRFSSSTIYVNDKWPSFEKSKAKSKKSFEYEYIRLSLETDMAKGYGEKEVERIRVTARPTLLDNTFSLIGCSHLLDTKIAQIVIDIFQACVKIRN